MIDASSYIMRCKSNKVYTMRSPGYPDMHDVYKAFDISSTDFARARDTRNRSKQEVYVAWMNWDSKVWGTQRDRSQTAFKLIREYRPD